MPRALSLKEFASYRQNTIVGASVQLTPPLGQYDADKLLNLSTNRWSLKAELGVSKAIRALTLEFAAAGTFYTDNDDFFGGKTREQDPIYSLQGHIIYSLGSDRWIGLDGTYYTGGRTTVDGVRNDDLQENTRLGITFAMPVDRHHSIKLFASTGVVTRVGSDFDTIGIAWQYRWGAGY